MATLEAIQPYVEQFFDDSDVQRHLSRASANLRGAKARAGRKRSKKKALTDATLLQRVLIGGREAFAAAVALTQAPEKQKKRSRRGRLLVLAALGAAGFVAANEQARNRVMGLLGGGGSAPDGQV
jgi:hypothetical protein